MTPVQDTCSLMTSAPWLTKTYLQTALSSCYSTSTLNITKYEVKPAVGKGDNYTSDIYRVKVFTDNGDVFHWIIKRQLSDDGEFGKMYRKSTGFLRETHMLSTTAVKLASMLQDAFPGGSEQFTARYIYACPQSIVMEDLCAEGFKMAERRQSLDLAHCLLVMRRLAKLHAASVVLHDQHPESMSIYDQSFFAEPIVREGLSKFFSGSVNAVAEAVDTWPGYAERYSRKLRVLADVMLDRILQTIQRDDNAFNVLIHGDLWTNNMLFRYSDVPEGLRFVDLQFTHFTSPGVDLQYFFNTSLCEEVRVYNRDRLLEEYHTTLCDTLNALGYSHKAISMEDLRKEYDAKVLYGVYGACCVLPITLSNKGMERDSLLVSGCGHDREVYNGDFYKKALQKMLPEFDEKGAFIC